MVIKKCWNQLDFSQNRILKESFRSKNSEHVFDNIKMNFKNVYIQNKCHDKNQHTYRKNSLRTSIL